MSDPVEIRVGGPVAVAATPCTRLRLAEEICTLRDKLAEVEEIVKAVAHIGIDFGYGKYELEQKYIDKARELTTPATETGDSKE